MLGSSIQSEIAVPVFLGKLPIAVINVESPDPIAFDRDYQTIILERFSREVAVMLAFAKLRTDVSNALEMQHANEVQIAIGDQVGNVIHTLNNTVGAIRYLVREIKQECDEQLRESDFLREAMDDIEQLSDRALDLPREMKGRIEKIDTYDVNELLGDVVKDMKPPEKVQLVWDLCAEDTRVRCFSLDLVVRNLVQNAVEAMPDGGKLRLATRVISYSGASGGYAELIVSDSGKGIDAAARSRLFDINFTTKKEKKGKGLGFGLWWIRQFVLRVNGEITVGPGEDGRGTSFIVRLPLANESSKVDVA
jgi:signal transduction histidine kinase